MNQVNELFKWMNQVNDLIKIFNITWWLDISNYNVFLRKTQIIIGNIRTNEIIESLTHHYLSIYIGFFWNKNNISRRHKKLKRLISD